MYLICFIASCFVATITIAIITCIIRINTHRHKTEEYKRIINGNLESEELKDFFLVLCDRGFDYIKVYFIFQGIAKSVNGLSLLFTVAGLVLSLSESVNKMNFVLQCGVIVSIITIVFVCIIIYINPTKRANQYLQCWRKVDRNLIKLISSLHNYNLENSNVSIEDYSDLQKFAMKCADDLSNGEYSITSDEE